MASPLVSAFQNARYRRQNQLEPPGPPLGSAPPPVDSAAPEPDQPSALSSVFQRARERAPGATAPSTLTSAFTAARQRVREAPRTPAGNVFQPVPKQAPEPHLLHDMTQAQRVAQERERLQQQAWPTHIDVQNANTLAGMKHNAAVPLLYPLKVLGEGFNLVNRGAQALPLVGDMLDAAGRSLKGSAQRQTQGLSPDQRRALTLLQQQAAEGGSAPASEYDGMGMIPRATPKSPAPFVGPIDQRLEQAKQAAYQQLYGDPRANETVFQQMARKIPVVGHLADPRTQTIGERLSESSDNPIAGAILDMLVPIGPLAAASKVGKGVRGLAGAVAEDFLAGQPNNAMGRLLRTNVNPSAALERLGPEFNLDNLGAAAPDLGAELSGNLRQARVDAAQARAQNRIGNRLANQQAQPGIVRLGQAEQQVAGRLDARAAGAELAQAPNTAASFLERWKTARGQLRTAEQIRQEGPVRPQFEDDPAVAQAAEMQRQAQEQQALARRNQQVLAEQQKLEQRLARLGQQEAQVPAPSLEVPEPRGNVRSVQEPMPPRVEAPAAPVEAPSGRLLQANPMREAFARARARVAERGGLPDAAPTERSMPSPEVPRLGPAPLEAPTPPPTAAEGLPPGIGRRGAAYFTPDRRMFATVEEAQAHLQQAQVTPLPAAPEAAMADVSPHIQDAWERGVGDLQARLQREAAEAAKGRGNQQIVRAQQLSQQWQRDLPAFSDKVTPEQLATFSARVEELIPQVGEPAARRMAVEEQFRQDPVGVQYAGKAPRPGVQNNTPAPPMQPAPVAPTLPPVTITPFPSIGRRTGLARVKSVQAISRDLQQTLGRLAEGRMGKPGLLERLSPSTGPRIVYGKNAAGAEGAYHLERDLIEARHTGDASTIYHEVGHAIDKHSNILKQVDPQMDAELASLGAQGKSSWAPGMSAQYRQREGLAEYMRLWMEDPQQAAALAPRTHAKFEGWLDGARDVGRQLRRAQADMQARLKAPAQARIRGHIVDDAPERPVTWEDFISGAADRFRQLEIMQQTVERGMGRRLSPDDAPYFQARMLAGLDGAMWHFLEKGPLRFADRAPTGAKGLRQIFEPFGQDPEKVLNFRDYLIARRAKELHGRNMVSGIDPADADKVFEQWDGQFSGIAQELYDWQDSVLVYAKDAGFLSDAALEKIRELNQNYVPFHRLYEVAANEQAVTGIGLGKGLQWSNPIKKIKGSQREIVDPFQTMVRNMASLITAAERNNVGRSIQRLWDSQAPGIGHFLSEIPAPMQATQAHVSELLRTRELRDALEGIGIDLDPFMQGKKGALEDLQAVLDLMPERSIWRKSNQVPLGENVIRVKDGDGHRFFRLNPELYKAWTALDEGQVPAFVNALSHVANVLRQGATTFSPGFSFRNLVRDSFDAATVSRVGSKPVANVLAGIKLMLGERFGAHEKWSDFIRQGGSQGMVEMLASPQSYERALKSIVGNMTPDARAHTYWPFKRAAGMAGMVLTSPVKLMRKMAELSEQATRLGEYDQALKVLAEQNPSWTPAQVKRAAAFEARDLLDFSQRGGDTAIRYARRMVPFLGSNIQGNYRLWKAAQEMGAGRIAGGKMGSLLANGAAFITAPTVGLYLLNRNNEVYWQLPQQERDLFWHLPVGGTFLRIPKPHLLGTMFATTPQRFAQYLDQADPQAFQDLGKTYVHQMSPFSWDMLGGPLGKTVVELATNHDFFRDKDIVPDWVAREHPAAYLQSDEYSSLTAKNAAKLAHQMGIRFSPIQFDHVVNNLTGYGGRTAITGLGPLPGIDDAVGFATGERKPAARKRDPFGLTYEEARFESDDRFQRELKERRVEADAAKAQGARYPDQSRLGRLEALDKRIKTLKKQRAQTQDPAQRKDLNRRIQEATAEWKIHKGGDR